jgi:hypothetical protein
MIEKTVYDYLSGCLSVPVMMELPEVPSEDYPTFPEEFVVLEKVAGSATDHINFATIAIQSYNIKSLYGAASLDKQVRNAMDAIAGSIDSISECQLTADTNFTDVSTKRYRYQCLYNIYY